MASLLRNNRYLSRVFSPQKSLFSGRTIRINRFSQPTRLFSEDATHALPILKSVPLPRLLLGGTYMGIGAIVGYNQAIENKVAERDQDFNWDAALLYYAPPIWYTIGSNILFWPVSLLHNSIDKAVSKIPEEPKVFSPRLPDE